MIRKGSQKAIQMLKRLRWTALAIAIAPASLLVKDASARQEVICNT